MPQEKKRRGRREDQKRKRTHDQDEGSLKRRRVNDDKVIQDTELEVHGEVGDDYVGFSFAEEETSKEEQRNQFFGLLEPEEQEYYANVNNQILANDFESEEHRTLFIQAVHRETQGKEIKVASSQSSSRYLEKVIMLSTAEQLVSLFSAFLENLNYLVQHRFGSHCCETLFIRAANFVSISKDGKDVGGDLTNLYIRAVEQLEPNIGFLLTERFASHAVRVLLLVLAGESLNDEATKTVVASRKKEKLEVPDPVTESARLRKVPEDFGKALQRLFDAMISSIDTTYLRALATHPVGNPVLQLMLKLELGRSEKTGLRDGKSLLSKLLPDDGLEPDSDSGKFIVGLIYDPTGSHLVESLIQYLPGKSFKKLYKNILKERMRNLSKNDIASYVAIKVLERLGKDDLGEVSREIAHEVPGLISRSRTGVLTVLFERSGVRQVDARSLANAVKQAYGADDVTMLPKMLHFRSSIDDLAHDIISQNADDSATSPFKADVHGSLLAQAMLQVPRACSVVQQSILAQPISSLLSMAKTPAASRVLQLALKSEHSSSQFRRQLAPRFYGHIAELACDAAGSHLADALWDGTAGLHFMKEKFAKELHAKETNLRESTYGRTVWRNWTMDTYSRHFAEWQSLAKGQAHGLSETNGNEVKKTPIELARERAAAKRQRAESGNK